MPNPNRRFSLLNRWICAAAIAVPVSALAQVRPPVVPPTGGDDQSSHDDKSTPPGVSVPDSPGAQERLDKARDKENQKQWKTAAEYYQEALTKFPGRVVPVKRDPESGIFHYAGIAPVIQERLAKWPEEGLKIYRNLYGQTAADLLTAAPRGDLSALRNIFWSYFVTDAGKTAGIRLVDNYLESGDFHAAAWTGDRLLSLHPALGSDRSMLLYCTALAYYRAGDSTNSQRLLSDLKKTGPTDIGTIAGKDVVLADALSTVLSTPAIGPTTRPWDADTYPSFGGIGERGDISPSTAKPGASRNSVTLAVPDFIGSLGGNRKQFNDSDRGSLSSGGAMGIMPVVDDGALFFQDGRSIYAVDTDSGAPLPGWLNTYSGEHGGRYKLSVFGRARNELLTITVTPSVVLAVMGQPDRIQLNNPGMANQIAFQSGQAAASTTIKLVCLDRDTGRELWTRIPADLPDSIAVLHTADYCGTPLVLPAAVTGQTEDSVLVVARGAKENQFDDCYIICLSARTGQYRWSTYAGSATRNYDVDGSSNIQPSQMALADGRVFVMTNLGNVAALDPSDGRVIWLNSYTRDQSDNPEAIFMRGGGRRFPQMQGNIATPPKPWLHNPVFVSDGYVYVLPNDARELLVYDEGSGTELKRIPMSQCDNAQVMLGVRDGIVCLTSENGVFAIDWKKFDPDRPAKFIVWKQDDITGGGGGGSSHPEPSTVCGRGFMTADSVFIPSKFRLIQKSWKLGKIMQFYPARGDFTGNQGPGNLLVTANNVIVAGQESVDVYTDLKLVRQRFELTMAASPNSPNPRMEYAEALFAGGQTKDALARVDQAIDLIGGLTAMRSGKDRAMMYNRILDFAKRTAKGVDKNTPPESIAMGNAFFDRAGAAAETPVQKATYRLERAKFAHQCNDLSGEVHLCQQVLSDDAMRSAVLENDVPAATAAETAIDVACSLDHSIYTDIEQQAHEAFQTAHNAADPQQLLAVAIVYPNSKAAVDARQEAVHRFEADNQPEKAIVVLNRMYTGSTDPSDREDLLVSIANDYLASPAGVGPAIDRLCRAARLTARANPGQKLRLPDGSTLTDFTFAQAIESLRKIQADQESAALPDFHIPPPTRGAKNWPFALGRPPVITNVSAVVHPLHDFVRNDQILTWSSAGLCVYPIGQTTPLVTIAEIDKEPLAAAWVHNSWIIWTTSSVYQVAGDGRLIWTFSTATLPALQVSTGGDEAINEAGDNPNDDTNQVINGRVVMVGPGAAAINLQRLRRMNAAGVAVAPAPPVVVPHSGDEEVVSLQPGGPSGAQLLIRTSIGRILALDGRNGQAVWQIRPADHTVDQLLANAHFTVVRIDDPAGSQLAVLETATGRVVGRRIYGPDNSPRQLVNVGLSEDATLAVTLFNQVMIKDLNDAWKLNFIELGSKTNNDPAPFVDLKFADQLLIKSGRLVCLYSGGAYARSYDLSKNADPTNPLATASDTAAVTLRMVGSRLFIVTSTSMHQYNLADTAFYPGGSGPRDEYEQHDVTDFPPKVRGLFLGKDYAVVVDDSVDRGPIGSPCTVLATFRRAAVPGKTREAGNVDYTVPIQQPSGVSNWPGVTDWLCSDGAIYYLTKDNNLHILHGARP